MYSSPEEISRLKNLLKQDPGFENSSSWPHLTEWCSTCTATRSMKLVLPEEEAKVPMEEEEEVTEQEVRISDCILQDASTQTPKQ